MNHRIVPLSEYVISQIKSTKEIRDLKTAVIGLVENSLDAGASRIVITLNFDKRSCKIEDDGHGIESEAFDEGGGLCRRYHTSKAQSDTAHSCNGIFLASLATLSFLYITSRVLGRHSTYLSMHHGRALQRGQPPVAHELAFAHGTTISVDDLLGNMPVRVKQYALLMEVPRAREKVFDSIKRGLVALLLAWPSSCSIRLHDAVDSSKSIILAATHPSISHAVTARALSRLDQAMSLSLEDKIQILIQAGLAPPQSRAHWKPVSAMSSRFVVKGLICLQASPSTRCQFISIGVTALVHDSKHGTLFESIKNLFAASSFGVVDAVDNELLAQPAVDRHPAFVFAISCKDEPSREPSTSCLKKLESILCEIVQRWLKTHGFRVRATRRARNGMQQGPTALVTARHRLPSSSEQVLAGDEVVTNGIVNVNDGLSWTNIKSARALDTSHTLLGRSQSVPAETPSASGQAFQERALGDENHALTMSDNGDEYVTWQDKVTRQQMQVNLRTGMTRPVMRGSGQSRATSAEDKVASAATTALPPRLRDWRPPVFTNACEEAIPSVCQHERLNGLLKSCKKVLTISRSDLASAEVIAQVDRKFIFCKLLDGQLVLLDQHAASERVLLEQLLADLLSTTDNVTIAAGQPLDKPIVFETPQQEFKLFQMYATHFAAWAIMYDATLEQQTSTGSQVRQPDIHHRISINALPKVIAERCRASPKLAIDLLRSEVWAIAEAPRPQRHHAASSSDKSGPEWLKHIDRIPKGILNMLNSRACRSAIMFNDALTLAECRELVARLSTTCFPFMCAHGRTSVVPLVNVDWNDTATAEDDFLLGRTRQESLPFSLKYSGWARNEQ